MGPNEEMSSMYLNQTIGFSGEDSNIFFLSGSHKEVGITWSYTGTHSRSVSLSPGLTVKLKVVVGENKFDKITDECS